ncbi:MAG: ACT domain-containing protein [Lentisphaerae bacterium]|nr:ACT domain-containing protein [Lentisphaerota bacterium]
MAQRYVLSVLIADRVGILSAITAAVTDLGANIEGISQTVVQGLPELGQGYFTVIMMAAFTHAVGEETIRNAILNRFGKDEASVLVRPYQAPRHACHAPRVAPVAGDRYILTMAGRDRSGILKALTGYLALKQINIEDLFFRIVGEQVTHIGEVTVPAQLDLKQIQDELRQVMAPFALVVSLQHENLFRVTNEVGAIRHLLREPCRA